jgi:hypothetical protein
MSTIGGEATLTTDFYDDSCPEIYSIVEAEVAKAVATEARNAASLLRLHFHDCFVNVSHSLFEMHQLLVLPSLPLASLKMSFVTVTENRFIFAYSPLDQIVEVSSTTVEFAIALARE